MTSPDKSVPAGAYTAPAGSGGGLPSLQKLTWQSAQQAIYANVMNSFSGFGNASTNLNGTTQKAMAVATNAQAGAFQAQTTAQAAQNTTAANSAVIAGLSAAQTGQQTGGVSFSDTFGRGTLGSGYTAFKTGPVADLIISNGQVQLNPSGDQNTGNVIALSSTVTQTNDQSVSTVMGAANQAGSAKAMIIARAAPDLSTFVYARIYSNSVGIGYGTRSNGSTNLTQTAATAVTVNTGDTVTLQAVGSNYEVLVNGAPIVGWTDTSVVSPVGTNNRSFGFGCEYYWSGLFPYFSFAVAGLAAADMSSPPVVGTGWGLYRLSSNGVTAPKGELAVPSSTFDNVRQTPNGVMVLNQGLGQVQVQKSGWYAVSTVLNFGSYDTTAIRADIWTAPSPTGTWQSARAGALTAVSVNSYSAGVSSVLYLSAGSVVAPGYLLNGNNTIVGPNTFFDGALLSG